MADSTSKFRIPNRIWYSIIMSYLCGIAVTAGALVYMKHVDNESNRKWCDIVVLLDNTYQKTPPQSEVGRQLASDMRKLKMEFEC